MKAKSSIHIAPGHPEYYNHNSRESFSHSQVFSDEDNEYSNDAQPAIELYQGEIQSRSAIYTNRVGQSLQKNTITHLSGIINLHDHHTMNSMNPIVEHLEATLDTIVTQIALHKDEGKLISKYTGEKLTSGIDFFMDPLNKKLYYDKEYTEKLDMSEWEIERNIHAHVEMLGIDSEGNSIKRNRLNKHYLRELQSFVAEALDMERGQHTNSYTRDQMEHIKLNMKPRAEYKNKKDYGSSFNKIAKQLGYFIPKKKRLDTHEYKAKMKSQNEIENVNRKARELLNQKDKAISNRQALLSDKNIEIDTLRRERLLLEKDLKVAKENNRELVYAKGWKRNGEPVEKDNLLAHLHKKSKKAISEKKLYVDKCGSLEEHNKEINDKNVELKIDNTALSEELQDSYHMVDILGNEVENQREKILNLEEQLQQIEQSKTTNSLSNNLYRI